MLFFFIRARLRLAVLCSACKIWMVEEILEYVVFIKETYSSETWKRSVNHTWLMAEKSLKRTQQEFC